MTVQNSGSETQRYLLAWSSLTELYMQRRFDDGLIVALDMQREFPARRTSSKHHQACLLCLAGRPHEALDRMREVANSGSWWAPPSLADPDLEPLHDDAEF